MEHFLRQITVNNSTPVEIPLRGDIIIGRIIHDLVDFRQVSRRHANLRREKGKWFIKDLGSINGVYLNQQKITKEEELQIGDHIGLGVNNPSSGFVCALSVRPLVRIKQEEIEVIDISDDDAPPIKLELPSNDQGDYSSDPKQGPSSYIPQTLVNPVNSSIPKVSVKSNEQQSIPSEDFSFTPKIQNVTGNSSCSDSRHSPHKNNGLQSNLSDCSDSNMLTSKVSPPEDLLKMIEKKQMEFKLVPLYSTPIPSRSNIHPPNPCKSLQGSSSVGSKIISQVPQKIEMEQEHQKSNVSAPFPGLSFVSSEITPHDLKKIEAEKEHQKSNVSKPLHSHSSVSSKITPDNLKKIEGEQEHQESNASKPPHGLLSVSSKFTPRDPKKIEAEKEHQKSNVSKPVHGFSSVSSKSSPHDLKKIEAEQDYQISNVSKPQHGLSSVSSKIIPRDLKKIEAGQEYKCNLSKPLKGLSSVCSKITPHDVKKIEAEQGHQKSNVSNGNLTPSGKSDRKMVSINKLNEVENTTQGSNFPGTSNDLAVFSVLNKSSTQNTRSDQLKVLSKSTSSIQSSDKCPQEQNCHLVKTSFGSLYSASSYLTDSQVDKSTDKGDKLLAVHKDLSIIKDCYVKLKRCDEKDEDDPEDLRFNAKRRRISSDSSDSENIPYSQVEDVIIIDSDDDDYYDFNPSQIVVKTEPIDEEELLGVNNEEVDVDFTENSKLFHSKPDKKLGNSNSCNNLLNPPDCRNTAILSNFSHSRLSLDDDKSNNEPSCSETIDDIRKFIENSSVNPDSDSSMSSHDDIIIPSKLKPKSKPAVKKSTGRILFTAPKPMERRPRSKRGREEWFEEKVDHSSTRPSIEKQSGKSPKSKKSPKNKTAPILKDFKIPKKIRPDGQKTPEKVRSSVLSAVEAPTNKSYEKGAGKAKKKAPVIARKPGKPSRFEMLASEPQIQPKRALSKPYASPPKKLPSSNNFPGRSVETISNASLNKIDDNKMKQSYSRSNIIETNHSRSNTGNRRVHFAENFQPPTGSRISGDPRAAKPHFSSGNYSRPSNQYQARVGDPQISRDPRLNKAIHSKSVGNLAPVYPAGDQFISESMNVREPNIPQITNPYLSKYNPSVSKPANSSKAETAVFPSYNRDILIRKIVKLNTKWLEEQNKKAEAQRLRGRSSKVKPPPAVCENAGVIPLSFNSLDEYVSAFTPLLMLEIWESMCDGWREYQNTRKFYFVIVTSIQKHGLREYVCKSIVNDLSFCPVRGSIVILNLRSDNKVQPLFGFVHDHHVEELGSNFLPSDPWKKCEPRWIQEGKWYKFNVYVKDRCQDSSPSMLLKGSGLCNIGTKINLMNNFLHLSKSPLLHYILSPTDKGFFMASDNVSPGREYNHDQMVAINSVCKEMTTKGPKIMLLQGPPGTGKSHTLVGLLEKLVYGRNVSTRRILVVAPSNAAIDEIGQRIIQMNQQSNRGIVRFVRVGVPNQIAKALQPYTLDSKLKEYFDNEAKSIREEIKKYREDIEKLRKQKSFDADRFIKELEVKITNITHYLTSQSKNSHNRKRRILEESNIVLSTLGSCSQNIVTSTFRPDSRPFSCVIVDEAAQCTELEMLQTMPFSTSKLILIGDHQQLEATVLSEHAKDFGLVRSMFERLHTCLTEKYRGSVPSLMLREQFRMNSEICKFPSRYFYHNKLFTSPSVMLRDEKMFQSCFQMPYVVLDILVSQENNNLSSSKTNSTEALVVINLCEQFLALKLPLSIGVITPYQGQCSLYTEAFKCNPNYSDNIEVNTVDGFQGQEKDVIILSCVRANRNGGIGFLACPKRLNVAITRARKILIICGCLSTLRQSPDWSALIDDARERKLIYSVTSEKEIPLLFQRTIQR